MTAISRPCFGEVVTAPDPLPIENFSHLCVGVSDLDASLAFYTGVLGMDVVFDVELAGAGLEEVTGTAGAAGRMVGGLIGATMIELLSLGDVPAVVDGPHLGYTNMSFRVRDLDAAHEALGRHVGVRYTPPTDIGGVRMLFVHDPDGTPIELIELPEGLTSTVQMWRGA
ncbi:VOC family protein [Mycobacterium manitobense]|uniref:VOC family protein n=1 Tax=[Mycobacterium] manitobense TaxID=190147 RepID=A0A9X2YN50_9MYCO|nr:VOC family protein [[Mycobacterium] manitobense]MCV7170425.1 VOC family protein [[Mycobacterium] manitobense]